MNLQFHSVPLICLADCCRICMHNYFLLLCRRLLCQAWGVQEWEGALGPLPHPWVVWACLQCPHLACHKWGPTDVLIFHSWTFHLSQKSHPWWWRRVFITYSVSSHSPARLVTGHWWDSLQRPRFTPRGKVKLRHSPRN